jgi:GT2 family glycosyltransferase
MKNEVLNVVLSYSSRHFNPNKGWVKGSAGEIASLCYEAARELVGSHEIIYIDSDMPETWPKNLGRIDTLITRDSNVALQISHFRPTRVLLIAVNQHIKTRNTLFQQSKKVGLPNEALDITDGVFEVASGAKLADKIIVVGDGSTRNTYINNGVSSKDIFPLVYSQKSIKFNYRATEDANIILVHMGSLGFRKGLDKILTYLASNEFRQSNLKVVVTGYPVNDYWAKEIEKFGINGKVNFPGWLDVHSDSFHQILQKTRFAIFPSREEGLSGAYLEIARTGIPVLTTRNVGIETLSELTLTNDSYEEFLEAVQRIVQAETDELEMLSSRQTRFLALIPNDGQQFKDAVRRFLLTGKIWPRVDLKLCVHNKASTIFELINSWDKSAEGMDNCRITVINDGSTDNSQSEIERAKLNSQNLDIFDILWADDVFEVRSNNLALKNGEYDFAVIIQDDNFCVDYDLLPELTATLDKLRKVAVIGGLAGVNFFPINANCECKYGGQHISTEKEHYQRIDENFEPALRTSLFEVDAVMRGPLIMSAQALSDVGLLDERYAPLYNDDMAWCYQAKAKGWSVFALLGGVINNSESMSGGTEVQKNIYSNAFETNAKLFYSEWNHSEMKDHLCLNRSWLVQQEKKFNRLLLLKFFLKGVPTKLRMYILVKFPSFGRMLRFLKHSLVRK